MIAFEQTAAPAAPIAETDPVALIATAMRELHFTGRTVTMEELSLHTGLEPADIEPHAAAARKRATQACIRRLS